MQSKPSDKIFADPVKVADTGDCYFYHTVELPGHGVINGIGTCVAESIITWEASLSLVNES